MPMNPEIKAKWVEALRSNKYYQGTGCLVDHESSCFCALGLLPAICDVEYDRAGFVFRGDDRDGGWYGDEVEICNGYLPSGFMERVGLEVEQAHHIARMNDSGKPFPSIADYISANL